MTIKGEIAEHILIFFLLSPFPSVSLCLSVSVSLPPPILHTLHLTFISLSSSPSRIPGLEKTV